MKRRTLDLLFSIGGVGLAALLLIIGVVMSSNADFSKQYVTDQLTEQKITFKAADGIAPCHHPLMMKPAAPATFMPW